MFIGYYPDKWNIVHSIERDMWKFFHLSTMLGSEYKMLYDVFISHASEDKDEFVRGLAEALRAKNVAVWYDEFSLKPGDSLRRSIDHGLSKSRFGIVVLSKAFIGKMWPEWELDGLVQRQNNSKEPVLLPVWLGLSYEEVLGFSPPLADKFAIRAENGIANVVQKLLTVIKPQGSSLVVARERLIEIGFNPPVVTDDWWHQAIEYCGSNPLEGSFQDSMGWGHWGFPLPPIGETASEKGERIAWAALQLNWQKIAKQNRFSQISHPETILEFINNTPGLRHVCFEYPHYLATYAPQLTVPGLGGDFEAVYDNWLEHSQKKQKEVMQRDSISGTGLTNDRSVPTCDEPIALHEKNFGNYKSSTIACFFVQGHLMGPEVKVYDTIDYLLWLLSDSSAWLPIKTRNYLVDGMKKWAVWPWSEYSNDTDFPPNKDTGALSDALQKERSFNTFKLTNKVLRDIGSRLEFSIDNLSLPESVDDIKHLFLECGAIEEWFKRIKGKKK
ncbi:MAG: toll/interleukin-1 receptor domain-containing protein [Desulfuromusa sp.]|jgi:hypothetical protein|nr:toll/interleukin-1 receptor domain-containing protein [Desulfuromusa sp.]